MMCGNRYQVGVFEDGCMDAHEWVAEEGWRRQRARIQRKPVVKGERVMYMNGMTKRYLILVFGVHGVKRVGSACFSEVYECV